MRPRPFSGGHARGDTHDARHGCVHRAQLACAAFAASSLPASPPSSSSFSCSSRSGATDETPFALYCFSLYNSQSECRALSSVFVRKGPGSEGFTNVLSPIACPIAYGPINQSTHPFRPGSSSPPSRLEPPPSSSSSSFPAFVRVLSALAGERTSPAVTRQRRC